MCSGKIHEVSLTVMKLQKAENVKKETKVGSQAKILHDGQFQKKLSKENKVGLKYNFVGTAIFQQC